MMWKQHALVPCCPNASKISKNNSIFTNAINDPNIGLNREKHRAQHNIINVHWKRESKRFSITNFSQVQANKHNVNISENDLKQELEQQKSFSKRLWKEYNPCFRRNMLYINVQALYCFNKNMMKKKNQCS